MGWICFFLREGAGRRTAILVNFGAEMKTVTLLRALKGGPVTTVEVPRYGVEVLAAKKLLRGAKSCGGFCGVDAGAEGGEHLSSA